MAAQNFFSTVPSLTFLDLAFTKVNLLLFFNLNSTSSTPLSWLSFGYQTCMQVFYITPALQFWFIVVSCVFQLFSFLDRFPPISPTPTKFHHHSNAWIDSMPVTPSHPRFQTPLPSVEKLQFTFSLDLLFSEISYSLSSFCVFLKVACLHVSFTAYENFNKLSKMRCLFVLFSTFFPSEVSEIRSATIKHISTYTLVHSSKSTYVVDHFFCP